MLDFLLQEEIKKHLRYRKIDLPVINKDKLAMSVRKLERYAKVSEHSVRYLIMAFAYFYVEVYQQFNFNQIYLKVGDFIDHHNMDIDTHRITEEDVDLAFELEGEWLNMNRFNVNVLPLQVRKFLSKHLIVIGKNTTFMYARNPISFSKIASWINRNRLDYPQIHGAEEFFVHLPAEIGCGSFYPEQYYDADKTLERYYRKVYDDIPKQKRFEEFYQSLHPSLKSVEAFKHSNLFSAKEIVKRLQDAKV